MNLPLGNVLGLTGQAIGRAKNTPRFGARTALYQLTGVDLTAIDGIDVTTVLTMLAESGPALSRPKNAKRFCSSPPPICAPGAYYRRLCTRLNKPVAIPLRCTNSPESSYALLTQGQNYVDAGQDYYE